MDVVMLSLLLFAVHGAIWLAIKSQGKLHDRAASLVPKLWVALLVIAVAFLIATAFATSLYSNYLAYPVLFIIPALAVMSLFTTRYFIGQGKWWHAWFASNAAIVATTFFGLAGMYPKLLPSSLDQAASLTIYNSSSSPLTLKIMLTVVLVFIPIIIAYQIWVYKIFSGKVTAQDLADDYAY